jgi:hypothetical protein
LLPEIAVETVLPHACTSDPSPKLLLNTDPSIVKLFNHESCPPKNPHRQALALYLVIELIDLDPVIGIDVSLC